MTRAAVASLLVLTLAALAVHTARVRPFSTPAGTGLVLPRLTVLAGLPPLPRIAAARPPDIRRESGMRVQVAAVVPGSAADAAGLATGAQITALQIGDAAPLWAGASLPSDSESLLRIWRAAYWTYRRVDPWWVRTAGAEETAAAAVLLPPMPVSSLSAAALVAWLQAHGLPLLTAAAFLGGATALLLMRTSGNTATSMLLALAGSALATLGPAYGGEALLGTFSSLLLFVSWLAAPFVFPLIGLAVLNFPSRAAVLTRHPWLPFALAALALPMLLNAFVSALFLAGVDQVLPLLAWLAVRRWTFDLPFLLATAANTAIAVEGGLRYRANRDVTERRRIQIAVLTGVPAVVAYGVLALASLAQASRGPGWELAWPLTLGLSLLVILPAIGLPYAAATRRLFAPRTVLRRSLQYALARRTLSLLLLLPAALLTAALLRQRDQPLTAIILGAPLFYAAGLALIAAGLLYRDAARQWLDRQFFRAEHQARSLLLSLANEVPFATDPDALVARVGAEIDRALALESVAILQGTPELHVRWQLRSSASALSGRSALTTLLRWSDEPLEVGGDDVAAAALRLPEIDRRWIADAKAACLVPMLSGTGETRRLAGLLVLGAKRSEEPFTSEERALLRGIGGQLAVALTSSEKFREVQNGSDGFTGVRTGREGVQQVPLPPARAEGQTRSDSDGLTDLVDGKYRIETRIGQGGMGTVYRAHDVRLDRNVALKIVRADSMSAEAQARFLREARIVARLQHPAVVTVFDVGHLPDGAAYLVMELIDGEDLRAVLRRETQLGPGRAAAIFAAVADGVDAAHRAGVLHRDLKPENIVLTRDGRPKVLDFGVAKLGDAASAASMATFETLGAVVGTPAYMAPEQLRGEPLDPRADIFSLGVALYECLTGALPFGRGSVVDYAVRYASGEALEADDALAPGLREPVLRALSLSRDNRHQSAAAFADAIRTAIRP